MTSYRAAPTRATSSKATKTATTTKTATATKPAGKSAAPGAHPSYADMVTQAISTLHEKKGSSRVAILKFIADKYKVGDSTTKVNAHLRMALKRGVTSGALKQTSGTGASGSFKLADGKAAAPKKAEAAKPSPKKAAAQPKKAAVKTTTPKKAASPKKKAAAKPKVATKTATQKKTKSPKGKKAATKL